jgi:hypothetical protein
MLQRLAAVFVLACLGYFVLFRLIEWQRGRKGPWEVSFASDEKSQPLLVIEQERIGVRGVRLTFEGTRATNAAVRVNFREARQVPFATPFGECVFLDTSVLPGTVTLRAYGHEIELLPRTLIIDHQERAWSSSTSLALRAR